MSNADQPFAEWAYAVHCCRECLKTILPAWTEKDVHITDGSMLLYVISNAEAEPRHRQFGVCVHHEAVEAGDEVTTLAVAMEYDRILKLIEITGQQSRQM